MRHVAIVVFFLYISYSHKSSLSQEVGPSWGDCSWKGRLFRLLATLCSVGEPCEWIDRICHSNDRERQQFSVQRFEGIKKCQRNILCMFNDYHSGIVLLLQGCKILLFKIFVVASQFPSPPPAPYYELSWSVANQNIITKALSVHSLMPLLKRWAYA